MKGYKVFDPDWTCLGKQYAVGETATQDGKLEMCINGIHFCTELADCFFYYSTRPDNKLAEVEAVGTILHSNENSKCCTDRLKIIKELSIAELLKDKAFCLEVIKRDASQMRFMEGQNQEVFLTAVERNGYMLVYVPESMKTPEVCLAAVKQNGHALRYVPEKQKTWAVCLAAVKQKGRALQYVPEHLKTQKLCLATAQQNSSASRFMPDHMK